MAAPVLRNCRASPRADVPLSVGNAPKAFRRAQLSKKEYCMDHLSLIDGIGFGAAGLVLATFCMRSMSALRWLAIASNVAFIAYAYLRGLAPVLLLHTLLLPVNICRLAQLQGSRSKPSDQDGASHPLSSYIARRSALPARRAVLPDVRVSWMR